jgi:CRISPR type III-B/RAMP module-associated protein Cmr5
MSTHTADPALDFALKCVVTVRDEYGKDEKGRDVQKKFRTRCRHLIESIYYSGLTYTLAYVASKAGGAVFEQVLKDPRPEAITIVRHVKEKVKGPEEASYALYGAFLLALLKQMEVSEVANANTILDVLKNVNTSATAVIAEERALKFAEWLKRLAESVFEAEQV